MGNRANSSAVARAEPLKPGLDVKPRVYYIGLPKPFIAGAVFDSEADTVVLSHTARSRHGFAEGALYAARWVVGKKGLFAFSEVFAR